jgi:hypothetical protein
MKKLMFLALLLVSAAVAESTTIEDWCPTLSGTPTIPPNCSLYGTPVWTCHTAQTEPWCCVKKTFSYYCTGEEPYFIDVIQQWNQNNAHCATDQHSSVAN